MRKTHLRRFGFMLGAALLFVAVVFMAGAVVRPATWHTSESASPSQRIYVLSNGFHSDIVVPVSAVDALGLDLGAFPVAIDQVVHLAIGWGSLTAYTSLRAVSDLTLGIVAKASAFDETVVHALPLASVVAGEGVYALDLTPAQYQRLVEGLAEDFASTTPMVGLTQGFGDLFFEGRGRFSPWNTCNSWTGAHLRAAGVAVGFWTPSAWSLEFGLKRL